MNLEKAQRQKHAEAGHIMSLVRKRKKVNASSQPRTFGMVVLSFRVDLPSVIKPFLEYPHRHMQRCVIMVILNSIKLAMDCIYIPKSN